MGLGTDAKAKIKQDALMTLGSASQKAGAFASQVVAAIAAVELPLGQWGELIEMLLGFVNTQANVNLRIATLQTIGFICESIVCPAFFSGFNDPGSHIFPTETGDPDPPLERNSDCGHPRRTEGGAVARGAARSDPCAVQFARVCEGQL
jgi:hypothetical protein